MADTCQIKSEGSNAKRFTFSFSECISLCMFTNRRCSPRCFVKPSQCLHSAERIFFVAPLKMPQQGNFLSVSLEVSQHRCTTCVQWRRVVVYSFASSLSASHILRESPFIFFIVILLSMQNIWFIFIYLTSGDKEMQFVYTVNYYEWNGIANVSTNVFFLPRTSNFTSLLHAAYQCNRSSRDISF